MQNKSSMLLLLAITFCVKKNTQSMERSVDRDRSFTIETEQIKLTGPSTAGKTALIKTLYGTLGTQLGRLKPLTALQLDQAAKQQLLNDILSGNFKGRFITIMDTNSDGTVTYTYQVYLEDGYVNVTQ